MLRAPAVQRELGLSEEQKRRIADLAVGYVKATRADFFRWNELSDPRPAAAPDAAEDALRALRRSLNEQSETYEQAATLTLDSAQSARLEQLKLHVRGVLIFFDRRIRAKLQITERQHERIAQLVAQCEDACAEIGRQSQQRKLGPEVARQKIKTLRRAARERAVAVLSAQQAEQLSEILGPRPQFEPDELQLRWIIEQ